MTVFSIEDRITAWVDDELDTASKISGEEFGRHVTMGAMQTPQGDAILWVILVTLRSPLLGQDAIGSTSKLQANIPPETAVRAGVKRSIEGLRKAYRMQESADGLPQGLPADVPRVFRQVKLN